MGVIRSTDFRAVVQVGAREHEKENALFQAEFARAMKEMDADQ